MCANSYKKRDGTLLSEDPLHRFKLWWEKKSITTEAFCWCWVPVKADI